MKLSLKKKLALEAYRLYRHNEIKAHPLEYFFWECTLRCNLHCQHCGSDCVKDAIGMRQGNQEARLPLGHGHERACDDS